VLFKELALPSDFVHLQPVFYANGVNHSTIASRQQERLHRKTGGLWDTDHNSVMFYGGFDETIAPIERHYYRF
jgi:hypothetical protein